MPGNRKMKPDEKERELPLRLTGISGRPANTTARAFVRKRGKSGIYQSHVTLRGKTVIRTTETRHRQTALSFNLLHLAECLKERRNPSGSKS